MDKRCNLPGKERRHCISNLHILLGPISKEEIIIREGLQASGLTHRQATALQRVGMDEVVPVLGDMACDCR